MRTRGAVPISRSEMQNGDKARGVFVNSPFNRACTKARACVRGSSIFSCCRRYLKINEPLRTRTERRTLNIPYVCCVPGIIVETRQGRENEGYLSRVGWHESLVLWTVSTYNLHYRGHAFSFAPFFPGLIWIHEDRMCNVVADVNDRVSDQSVWSWMREYDCDNSIAWRHMLRRITYSRNSFGIFLRELFWQWAHQIHALSLAPVIVKLRSETSRRLFSRQWRAISENRVGFEFTIFSWPHCLSEDLGVGKRWTYLIDLRRILVKGGSKNLSSYQTY